MRIFRVTARFLSLGLFGAVVFIYFIFVHAQDSASIDDAEPSAEDIRKAFKKAMHEVYDEREAKQGAYHSELNARLDSAISEWLVSVSRKKQQELNQLVDQRWEYVFRYGPRVHYDYYLRGYDFLPHGSELIKKDSAVAPYAAKVNFLEALYVQRKHPAGASNVSKFFYTVTTPLLVQFDYKDNNFVLISATKGDASIEQDWPNEALERIKKENYKF